MKTKIAVLLLFLIGLCGLVPALGSAAGADATPPTSRAIPHAATITTLSPSLHSDSLQLSPDILSAAQVMLLEPFEEDMTAHTMSFAVEDTESSDSTAAYVTGAAGSSEGDAAMSNTAVGVSNQARRYAMRYTFQSHGATADKGKSKESNTPPTKAKLGHVYPDVRNNKQTSDGINAGNKQVSSSPNTRVQDQPANWSPNKPKPQDTQTTLEAPHEDQYSERPPADKQYNKQERQYIEEPKKQYTNKHDKQYKKEQHPKHGYDKKQYKQYKKDKHDSHKHDLEVLWGVKLVLTEEGDICPKWHHPAHELEKWTVKLMEGILIESGCPKADGKGKVLQVKCDPMCNTTVTMVLKVDHLCITCLKDFYQLITQYPDLCDKFELDCDMRGIQDIYVINQSHLLKDKHSKDDHPYGPRPSKGGVKQQKPVGHDLKYRPAASTQAAAAQLPEVGDSLDALTSAAVNMTRRLQSLNIGSVPTHKKQLGASNSSTMHPSSARVVSSAAYKSVQSKRAEAQSPAFEDIDVGLSLLGTTDGHQPGSLLAASAPTTAAAAAEPTARPNSHAAALHKAWGDLMSRIHAA